MHGSLVKTDLNNLKFAIQYTFPKTEINWHSNYRYVTTSFVIKTRIVINLLQFWFLLQNWLLHRYLHWAY